jgi:hypothetical protein
MCLPDHPALSWDWEWSDPLLLNSFTDGRFACLLQVWGCILSINLVTQDISSGGLVTGNGTKLWPVSMVNGTRAYQWNGYTAHALLSVPCPLDRANSSASGCASVRGDHVNVRKASVIWNEQSFSTLMCTIVICAATAARGARAFFLLLLLCGVLSLLTLIGFR